MKRSLTTSQAGELLRAASLLPPATRDQFLSAVDSRLVGIRRQLTDDDVHGAIIATLGVLDVTTASHTMCDAASFSQQEVTMTRDDDAFDSRGLLKDKRTLRVPLEMMDSYQKGVAQHFADRRLADSLHRPGERRLSDAAGLRRKEEAYREMVDEMTNAWRKPARDAVEFIGEQPGDECTINGAPGHLNHRLECVPDRQRSAPRRQDSTMSAADAQAIKDAAWNEMVAELTNAWRTR